MIRWTDGKVRDEREFSWEMDLIGFGQGAVEGLIVRDDVFDVREISGLQLRSLRTRCMFSDFVA